jgi:XTP/dITP diphosphohydrolase
MGRLTVALASTNKGKLRELRALLGDWDIEPLAAEYPDETGDSFYANARAKALFARTIAAADVCVLGEDSGLEVEGLGGAPGIRSARYAGRDATDADNVAELLDALRRTSGGGRRARYVSELVLISPERAEFRGTGTLEGRIAMEPRGSGGFGYDPVFVPDGFNQAVAELGDAWKAENSHRAKAARALLAALSRAVEAV